MQYKSEKYFKDYLEKIPNERLMQFYDEVEWTPFPVLVLKEYQNRFKAKNKKEVKEKLRTQVQLAKQRSALITKKIKTKGSDIRQKTTFSSSTRNLELVEKLADLKKKRIITAKEFQDKKKELLERI